MIALLIALGFVGSSVIGGVVGFVLRGRSEFERLMREYRLTISRAAEAAREGQQGLAEILTEQAGRLLDVVKKYGGTP